jgi:hypothetical protein
MRASYIRHGGAAIEVIEQEALRSGGVVIEVIEQEALRSGGRLHIIVVC